MLEVGGRLVYSTCSLNPLEDEAVIYRMLVEAGDAIQLADAAEKVQGLKYSTGISKWKIAMKDGAMYTEFDQVWSLNQSYFLFAFPFPSVSCLKQIKAGFKTNCDCTVTSQVLDRREENEESSLAVDLSRQINFIFLATKK